MIEERLEFFNLGFLEERALIRAQGQSCLELLRFGQLLAFRFLLGTGEDLALTGVHGQFLSGLAVQLENGATGPGLS